MNALFYYLYCSSDLATILQKMKAQTRPPKRSMVIHYRSWCVNTLTPRNLSLIPPPFQRTLRPNEALRIPSAWGPAGYSRIFEKGTPLPYKLKKTLPSDWCLSPLSLGHPFGFIRCEKPDMKDAPWPRPETQKVSLCQLGTCSHS